MKSAARVTLFFGVFVIGMLMSAGVSFGQENAEASEQSYVADDVTAQELAGEAADGENSTDYVTQVEAQTGNIFVDIADGNVPLGSIRTSGVWSLLSLILSLVAVGSTSGIAGLFRRKSQAQNAQGQRVKDRKLQDRNAQEDDISEMDAYDAYEKKRNEKVRAASIAFGALTLLLWAVLDDISTPMTWVNKWTLYIGLCFLIHLVLLLTFAIRLKTDEF